MHLSSAAEALAQRGDDALADRSRRPRPTACARATGRRRGARPTSCPRGSARRGRRRRCGSSRSSGPGRLARRRRRGHRRARPRDHEREVLVHGRERDHVLVLDALRHLVEERGQVELEHAPASLRGAPGCSSPSQPAPSSAALPGWRKGMLARSRRGSMPSALVERLDSPLGARVAALDDRRRRASAPRAASRRSGR